MASPTCLLCSGSDISQNSHLTSNQLLCLCKIFKISNPDVLFQQESFTSNSSHICTSCCEILTNAQQLVYQLQELESKLAEIGQILRNVLQQSNLSKKNRSKNDSECSDQLQTLLCQAARVKEADDYIEIIPLAPAIAGDSADDIDDVDPPEVPIPEVNSNLDSDSNYDPNDEPAAEDDESDSAKSEDPSPSSPVKPKRRRSKPVSTPCVYSSCHETFQTYKSMRKHLYEPHDNINADTTFLCSLCDHSELTYSDLSQHIQSNHEPEVINESAQLPCQFCGEHFSTIGTFRKHLSSHDAKEPLLCNTCGKTYENKTSLGIHMKQHVAESGQFQCEKCDRTFTTKPRLENHRGSASCFKRTRRGPSCRHCKKIFEDEEELEGHRNDNPTCRLMHQKALQKCPQCRDHVPEGTNLDEHLKECQGWHRGICPYQGCRKKYLDDKALRGHLSEPHELTVDVEASFKCATCEDSCSTYNALKTHVESSHAVTSPSSEGATNPSPFWCQICGNSHPDVRSLRAHVKQDHKLPFECAKCSKTFTSSSTLTAHKKTHKDPAPGPSGAAHSCLGCKESFATVSALRTHLRTCEVPIVTVYCEECGRDFDKQTAYMSHMIQHTLSSMSCDVCEKEFKSRCLLMRHRRLHFPELKLRCQICSAGFLIESALKKHIKGKHFLETEGFKCDHCEYRCVEKSMMERHTRLHTGERPFVCDVCGIALTNAHGLKLHMKLHEDRPYKCEICGFAFVSNFKYARHVKTHIRPKIPHYKILRKLAAEAAEREKEQSEMTGDEQPPVLGTEQIGQMIV